MMTTQSERGVRLVLEPMSAAEMMTPNPISISADATVDEATTLLTDRGFSAAPVIDEAGRPVGVVSRADLLVHDRERMTRLRPMTDVQGAHGFAVAEADTTPVSDIMTPVVFSVMLDTPADRVAEQMLEMHVHQLFVVDRDGSLVDVISSLDVLRHLRQE